MVKKLKEQGGKFFLFLLLIGGSWKIYDHLLVSRSVDKKPLPTIAIAPVENRLVPWLVSIPGSAQSPQIVEIRPRVEGQIMSVHFKDGQQVRKGDLLYVLDVDPLRAQLAAALEQYKKDQAQCDYARALFKRKIYLLQKGAATRDEVEQQGASLKSLEETLKADEAAYQQLRLQVGYGEILSPIDGKIGFNKGFVGTMVHPTSSDPLVTVAQIDPIEVVFSLPETYKENLKSQDLSQIPLSLEDINKKKLPLKGSIFATDNQINQGTGTWSLKARFENKGQELVPGQYLAVWIQLPKALSRPLAIPLRAIQTGQKGFYTYVYNPQKKKVYLRWLQVSHSNEEWAQVKEGLQPQEWVVTQGHLRLKDGLEVDLLPDSQASLSRQSRGTSS